MLNNDLLLLVELVDGDCILYPRRWYQRFSEFQWWAWSVAFGIVSSEPIGDVKQLMYCRIGISSLGCLGVCSTVTNRDDDRCFRENSLTSIFLEGRIMYPCAKTRFPAFELWVPAV